MTEKERRAKIEAVENVLAKHGINTRREPSHVAPVIAREIVDAITRVEAYFYLVEDE